MAKGWRQELGSNELQAEGKFRYLWKVWFNTFSMKWTLAWTLLYYFLLLGFTKIHLSQLKHQKDLLLGTKDYVSLLQVGLVWYKIVSALSGTWMSLEAIPEDHWLLGTARKNSGVAPPLCQLRSTRSYFFSSIWKSPTHSLILMLVLTKGQESTISQSCHRLKVFILILSLILHRLICLWWECLEVSWYCWNYMICCFVPFLGTMPGSRR